MPNIATLFTHILTSLRMAVASATTLRSIDAHLAGRDAPRNAVLVLLWTRIGRMATRFESLFARWQAGTLPKPRPSRPGQARTPPAHPQPRLPRRRAWLLSLVPQGRTPSLASDALRLAAATAGARLQHLLTHPDMAEFLRAAPQAGRILRPLWHMVSPNPAPELLHAPAPSLPAKPAAAPPLPLPELRRRHETMIGPPVPFIRFSPA